MRRFAPLRQVLACLAFGACCLPLTQARATEPTMAPWSSLTSTQQATLAPLKDDWIQIDNARRQKWLELASRLPAMPIGERDRIQQRMADWSRMTPAERGRARLAFQQSREFSANERQARWQAYQALPDEERQRLAERSRPAPKATAAAPTVAKAAAGPSGNSSNSAKRNIVTPMVATPARTVAPSVVQAKPGATTSPVSKSMAAPSHTQPGLPKVAATPNFVDQTTLLPKRGAQAAAMAQRPGAGRQNVE